MKERAQRVTPTPLTNWENRVTAHRRSRQLRTADRGDWAVDETQTKRRGREKTSAQLYETHRCNLGTKDALML